jgi:hypothetical protein
VDEEEVPKFEFRKIEKIEESIMLPKPGKIVSIFSFNLTSYKQED